MSEGSLPNGFREDLLYARHRLLDGWDQVAIEGSTVLIAGIGALGCEISKNLALSGVGHLILVDMDTIEISNLSRQFLFRYGDRGRYKAEVAAERLLEMNPDIDITFHTCKFQEIDTEVIRSVDVLVGGLDSFNARFDLNRLANGLGKVYIDSASTGFKGNVQVVVPDDLDVVGDPTPCFRCFYPVPPSDDMWAPACTVPGEARNRAHCILKAEEEYISDHGKKDEYTPDDLTEMAEIARQVSIRSPHLSEEHFKAGDVENTLGNKLPALITVNAVVSAILSHEVLKVLHRIHGHDIGPSIDPSYLEYNAEYGIFTPLEIKRDPECPVCGASEEIEEVLLSGGASIDDLSTALSGYGIEVRKALVTRSLNGALLWPPGKVPDGAISDLGLEGSEILRFTYTNSDGQRGQKEIRITMEAEQ